MTQPAANMPTANKVIDRCRVCHNTHMPELFTLGDQYISNFVGLSEVYTGPRCPITLVLCATCGLVQQKFTAPQDFMYTRHYWYRSGVTHTMREALSSITDKITRDFVNLKPGDIVLDIGSNDGTLLRSYNRPDIVRVGVEPAVNLAEEGQVGLDVFVSDFWNVNSYLSAVRGYRMNKSGPAPYQPYDDRAKVITAIGMFYDLDDPNTFINHVAQALAPDGLFVAQLMCLGNMLRLMDVGNLSHEHLEFYSLKSLYHLYEKNGLQIIDIDRNKVNGESYRIYARKKETLWNQSLQLSMEQLIIGGAKFKLLLRQEEEEYGLGSIVLYDAWFAAMKANARQCRDFIKKEVAAGKRVWVYGASTKGNVILQFFDLDSKLIEGAADKSPEKHGKYTVGSGIPIYSEQTMREANPDYLLVLPYAFLDEFMVREDNWRSQGGKFIVPLPQFKVV